MGRGAVIYLTIPDGKILDQLFPFVLPLVRTLWQMMICVWGKGNIRRTRLILSKQLSGKEIRISQELLHPFRGQHSQWPSHLSLSSSSQRSYPSPPLHKGQASNTWNPYPPYPTPCPNHSQDSQGDFETKILGWSFAGSACCSSLCQSCSRCFSTEGKGGGQVEKWSAGDPGTLPPQ